MNAAGRRGIRLGAAALSGALLGFGHAPGPALLGVLAPVPWLAFLVADRGVGHRLPAYVFGLAFFGAGLRWLADLHPLFPVGAAALLALYPLLAAVLYRRASALGPGAALALLPAILAGVDFLRERALTGFPWLLPGHLLAGSESLRQGADLLGVPLLSLAVLAVDAGLAGIVAARLGGDGVPPPKARWGVLAAGLLLLLGLRVHGARRLDERPERPGPRVVLVQPCFAQGLKVEARKELPTRARMINDQKALSLMAHDASPEAELFVWGETMLPGPPGAGDLRETAPGRDLPDPATRRVLVEVTDPIGIVRDPGPKDPPRVAPAERRLLTGAVFLGKDGGRRNAMLLVGPGGRIEGRFEKVHLTPFGEYLPLVGFLPEGGRRAVEDWILGFSPFLPDLVPGEGKVLPLDLPRLGGPVRVGGLVCYEVIFPAEARARVRDGADLLVCPGNYAWYGPSCRDQILAMARLRAVEVRRPLLLVGNDGPTAILDGHGRTRAELAPGKPAYLAADVPLDGRSTLYLATGDLLGMVLLVVAFGAAAAGGWSSRRREP